MGSLKATDGLKYEVFTEPLDEARWWTVLRALIGFLESKTTSAVELKYGSVHDRDLSGRGQGENRVVDLSTIESVVRDGLQDRTIKRLGESDFTIRLRSPEFAIMLCKDADIHIAANDMELLHLAKETVIRTGVTVQPPVLGPGLHGHH